jgi:DNA helicase-2/ATP-dependent DNA helicase PcrA
MPWMRAPAALITTACPTGAEIGYDVSSVAKLLEIPRPADPYNLLNPQQRAAVRHGEGPLLVVAGAGTGKTRVITERIRHLLESDPALPGQGLLGLTFTDKAAAVMKHRVVRAVGERGKDVWLGTFHSFCHALLAEANPAMQILDDVDHWILLRRNLPLLALNRYRRLAEPGQFLADFVKFFSRCQDELVSPDDYQRYADDLAARYQREKAALKPDAQRLREEELARQQEITRVYRSSDLLLRERGLMTFGGLLLGAVRELENNSARRRELQARYRYILVDEFQDTNIAQIELLWLLAGGHRNIVAVGDDDQAIYRFRGASFGSFMIFLEKFTGAQLAPGDRTKPIQPLTHNYRSTGRILRVAGQVIAQNERSPLLPGKQLTPQKPDGEKIRIVELGSAAEEAQWIAAEMERLHRAGQRWGSFAALYRMHTHRESLVEALAARRIPFVIKNLSILDNTLVRDIVAYLRLIAAPSDNVACARVLAAPGWGLEPADLVRLCERASASKGLALWDALQLAQGELPFVKSGHRTAELVALISSLRRRARHCTAAELLDELAAELDLGVLALPGDQKYMHRFAQFVREWEPKSATRQLAEFVEYLDYFQQAGGQINLDAEAAEDAVQLMTVHAAKGLEFDHVFVMRLVRGGFPVNTRPHVLEFPAELMKEEKPRGDFHIQEERRLFYVALTRARERLTLTTVVHRRSKPSVFLDDILMEPKLLRGDVQQLSPKASSQGEAAPAPRPEDASLFDPEGDRARVNSRIARWAESYRPPVDEPLRLSASTIDTYQLCPQKYLFQRVWGIREGPHAAPSFGSVMHTTIRQLMTGLRKKRRLPFEDVEAIFRREWSSAGFEDAYQEEEYKKDGLEQLRAFHASCVASPPEMIAQEKFFELPMDDNVVITGRIDQVNRLGPNQDEIVDYKTGRPKLEPQARKSLQLSLYALAAREVLDLNPVRLTFYNLQSNEAVFTSRGEKELDQAREVVQEVAAEIRAGQFPAHPGFLCRSCAYQPLCPAHEQLVAIRPAAR